MQIISMTPAAAAAISIWTYPSPYDCYSFSPSVELTAELLSGDYFAAYDGETLIGYYCFGAPARIPVQGESPYERPRLDMGLGLCPSRCGQGLGASFLEEGLKFAAKTFGDALPFRLTVLERNERARKVYEKAGFVVKARVLHRMGTAFLVMERDAV